MQDGERKIPIHFRVKRSKVKVTTELCQHFGSDTITWVLVFNVQLSYFMHRCRMARGRYLYMLGSKGHGDNRILSILWGWHNNLSSFQYTAFMFHTQMQDGERNVPLHFEVRGSKFKVIIKKVTVIVTDLWRGPFWLCQCSSCVV